MTATQPQTNLSLFDIEATLHALVDACEIPLSRGMVAIVDREDFESLNKFKWCATWNPHTRSYYAMRKRCDDGGKQTSIWMSREVIKAPKGVLVDHRNHDTLDNRKCNLRRATHRQNQFNKPVCRHSKTGVKGVSLHRKSGKYSARIQTGTAYKHLGLFATISEAKVVYDAAAIKYHGEFAYES